MCDHTVGYLHNFVLQSEIAETLRAEARDWNSHSSTMASIFTMTHEYKTDYKASDFVDRRRGMMTVFNNCPYCGEKIDWKAIKKELNS